MPISTRECTELTALSFETSFKYLGLKLDMWYHLDDERSFVISPKCFERSLCVTGPTKIEP